jgi:signal transduction histidine kinase
VVEVADEGPGIPAAERTRVFERFTRGAVADNGGTGLGLAIARWVVELHGGTIAVIDPEPGRGGCRIRFRVPAGLPAGISVDVPVSVPVRVTR